MKNLTKLQNYGYGLCAVILVSCFAISCGVSEGPSLLSSSVLPASTITAKSNLLKFTNGMNAYTVLGQTDFVSGSSGCGASTLCSPRNIDYGASGTLWIADSCSRALALNSVPASPGGTWDFAVGQNNTHSGGDGTGANQMDTPTGISEQGSQLFVSDSSGKRVQVFSPVPTDNGASAIFTVGSSDPALVGAGTCDAQNIGSPLRIFTTTNYLFVPDGVCNRVLIYSLPITGNQPTPVRILGQTTSTGSGAATTRGGMSNPTAVWSDGDRIAVVDGGNNRVLIWNTFPTSDGLDANLVLGQTNFTSSGSGVTQSRIDLQSTITNSPEGGIFSSGEQLFLADTNNNRILIWNSFPTLNGQSADAVLGQSDFTTSAAATTRSGMNSPLNLVVHSPYVFAVDYANNRVMVWKGQ